MQGYLGRSWNPPTSHGHTHTYSPFVFSWRVDDVLKLPLPAEGRYDFSVEWGDGTSSHIHAHDQPEASHRYQAAGDYRLHVTGDIVGFCAEDLRKSSISPIQEISQWGCLRLTTAAGAFSHCTELINKNLKSMKDQRAYMYLNDNEWHNQHTIRLN